MPRCVATLDGMPSTETPDPIKPDLDMAYPVVGVLDSGIAPIGQLQPWLMEKRLSIYTDNELDKRHGTFVAGVITYGDRFEHSQWVGGLPPKLLDGAVFPADGNVDESTMVDSIKTIVGAMRDRVRVWNLSLSFMDEISDNEFSEFGMALDAIQDDYGVLICKSAGNCDVRANGTRGRLYVGSDSVRALTVGSAAQVKAPLDQAGVGEASPFSRKGQVPSTSSSPRCRIMVATWEGRQQATSGRRSIHSTSRETLRGPSARASQRLACQPWRQTSSLPWQESSTHCS